ncbi:MAG: hypothetical protein AABZ06_11735 [Bdellovibrionota bacterium]
MKIYILSFFGSAILLLGCQSNVNNGIYPLSGNNRIYTLSEIVAPVHLKDYKGWGPQDSYEASDKNDPPLTVRKLLTFGNDGHDDPTHVLVEHGYALLVRIYRINGNNYDLVWEYADWISYLKEPEFIYFNGLYFLLIAVENGGSSTYRKYYMFWMNGPELKELEIEDPIKSISNSFKPGEYSESGRVWFKKGKGSPVDFEFAIWKKNDLSNHPTGGHVEGCFKIVNDSKGMPLKIVVDSYRHDPPDEPSTSSPPAK